VPSCLRRAGATDDEDVKEGRMAELRIDGDELVLALTAFEKAESIHGDVRVPFASVRTVDVLDDAHGAIGWHGIKAPASRLPGVFEVGTFRIKGTKIFAVIHHDTPRGVRVGLEGAGYDALLVGAADPEAIAATLRAGMGSPA
jgi:hypothetical protein